MTQSHTFRDYDGAVSFEAFCRQLEHVRPRRTMRQLDAHLQAAFADDLDLHEVVVVGDATVTLAELRELQDVADCGTRIIRPASAAVLIRLYRAGALDTDGAAPGTVSPSALAYADDGRQEQEAVARQREAQAARRARLKHPDAFSPEELGYALLNAIFYANRARGNCEMTVGGVLVRKTIESVQCAQPGGERRITFAWTGPDGKPRRESRETVRHEKRRRA